MLKADMLEKNSSAITVHLDENIAEAMFRFLYTGKVEGLEEIAEELIDAAVMVRHECKCKSNCCIHFVLVNIVELISTVIWI